jgi:excinuclease ABC subunit A
MRKIEDLDSKKHIIIKGAKMHNLRDVDVAIKRNSFTVVSGLSGSGKSSLAFDTLYAEGQRRYIESLSSYARQFLGKIEKPKVDYIRGISPAVAIEQKVNTRNPRSTVGTSTELYDYIKLLYARAGRTYSPVSGQEVKKNTVMDVVDFVLKQEEGAKLLLTIDIVYTDLDELKQKLDLLEQNGFARILVNDKVERLSQIEKPAKGDYKLIVDRIVVNHEDEGFQNRLADSVELAFYEGRGVVHVREFDDPSRATEFSNLF